MATIRLPRDFSEFLKLLNSSGVEYLLVGGYAVNYYGYVRSTGNLDVWVSTAAENIQRVVAALRQFGFADATVELLDGENRMLRMGVPPLRLEILTSISGVEFGACYRRRRCLEIDGVAVPVIALEDLKRNKRASGRAKDLADLDELG